MAGSEDVVPFSLTDQEHVYKERCPGDGQEPVRTLECKGCWAPTNSYSLQTGTPELVQPFATVNSKTTVGIQVLCFIISFWGGDGSLQSVTSAVTAGGVCVWVSGGGGAFVDT